MAYYDKFTRFSRRYELGMDHEGDQILIEKHYQGTRQFNTFNLGKCSKISDDQSKLLLIMNRLTDVKIKVTGSGSEEVDKRIEEEVNKSLEQLRFDCTKIYLGGDR